MTKYVVSCSKHKLVQGSYVILKKIQYIPGWIELNFHDISDAYTYQTSRSIHSRVFISVAHLVHMRNQIY